VRRSVAEVIAPPWRARAGEPPADAPDRSEAPAVDTDARFDAARERLKSKVAPPDEEGAE